MPEAAGNRTSDPLITNPTPNQLSYFVPSGIKVIKKDDVEYQDNIELDACLTGCGALVGNQHYHEEFPREVQEQGHTIAHLEHLNIVVSLKMWAHQWQHHKVRIYSDNINACIAVQTGWSRDDFMQDCAREIILWCAMFDIDITVLHKPGVQLQRADALSRAHTEQKFRDWIETDKLLREARRVRVPEQCNDIVKLSDLFFIQLQIEANSRGRPE